MIRSQLTHPAFTFLLGLLLCLHAAGAAQAQTTSTWSNNPNSTDWFDPLNWNNGVPNAPGDVAQVNGSPVGNVEPELTAPATLGQLVFSGSGEATLGGVGPLTIGNPGDDPATITTLPPRNQGVNATVAAPISIQPGEQLNIDLARATSLTLSGGIVSTEGDVTKTGEGRLTLSGNSQDWDGVFTVSQGDVVLKHADALGSTVGVTHLTGGRVLIEEEKNTPPPRTIAEGFLSESFVLETGILETTQNHLDLLGSLHLPAGNSAVIRGPFDLKGGTTGEGDLTIIATGFASTSASEVPLAHRGNVSISSGETTIQFAGFDGDNSYTGLTEITDVRMAVRTPNGLGTSDVGTIVTRGMLQLHGGSQEDVALVNSTLALWNTGPSGSELRAGGSITLQDSTLTTSGGSSSVVVEKPVQLKGGTNRIETGGSTLALAGGIEGYGDLVINPDNIAVNIDSKIQHHGSLRIRRGPVRFRIPDAYSGDMVLDSGRIFLEADQRLRRIRTDPLLFTTGCCSHIEVAEGVSLTVDHLDIVDGLIRGSVHTSSGLHFAGFKGGLTVSHVDTDLDIRIAAGEVTVDDSIQGRAPTNGRILIGRSREASAYLAETSVIDADFYLNNGSGFNYGGALVAGRDTGFADTTTIRGDIHLGDQGAYIGGWQERIRIEGQIYGGDLNLGRQRRTPGLILVAGQAAYTGATRVYSGRIVLSENGSLANTSGIELYSEGALVIKPSETGGPVPDRVADQIPIALFGGEVKIDALDVSSPTTERLGSVFVERGLSELNGGSGSNLIVADLHRDPGSILVSRWLLLKNPPPVTNGILPAWFLGSPSQFATYGPKGVEQFAGQTVPLQDSDDTSVVRPDNASMNQDRDIHAWYGVGNTPSVEMNGHTLTVGSGGLIGARLSNGTIVPGQHANGELVISTDYVVNANIADNGSPTSVIYVGDGKTGGTNTYTGTTYVVGRPGDDVEVTNAAAIPSGGDIEISGYVDLALRDVTRQVSYRFGNVGIRDGGTLVAPDLGDTVTAERILLESGRLDVALTGNFPIVKQTDGLAVMSRVSPDYSGTIDVLEGTLHVSEDGSLVLGQATVNVEEGARLSVTSSRPSENGKNATVLLNGGSLLGSDLYGNVEIIDDSFIYTQFVNSDRAHNADVIIYGQLRVSPGVSLNVIGRPDVRSGLVATGGIDLGEGAILGGTATIHSTVEISDGTILSPGLAGESASVGLLATSRVRFADDFGESRMTWGEGARYHWEINDAAGDAGAPFGRGWDTVRIGGMLRIDATPESPVIIEPVGLTPEGELGFVRGLNPDKDHRWLIAEVERVNGFSATITGFAEDKFILDVSRLNQFYPQIRAEDFWLDFDSEGIHLNLRFAVIPEPSTLALAILAFLALAQLRRSCRQFA